MQLYGKTFFNQRNWVLENFDRLDLTHEELLCVLFIDFFNEFNLECNIHTLAAKLKKEDYELDEMLERLIHKNYLSIQFMNQKMVYSLEGLFITTDKAQPVDQTLLKSMFDVFESEFKRPLSQKETQQLSQWISIYPNNVIIHGLKQASVNDSLSFAYIDRIIVNTVNGIK